MKSENNTEATERRSKRADPERAHLTNVEDGCGCTEIWEHMSENRSE